MFDTRLKTHHSAIAAGREHALGPRPVRAVLAGGEGGRNATIYIHVPFCAKICTFCNMRRSLQVPMEEYHTWIVSEIEQYAALPYVRGCVFDAVYFGGGTPTTLSAHALERILQALFRNFQFTDTAEITIETTVTELTDEKIRVLGENGVTRFSVGVQTFHDAGRRQMNRTGSGECAYRKLEQLKNAGKFTVSMDLIYNYAGQTAADLQTDLEKIRALDLDGFSLYSLIDMKDASMEKAQGVQQDGAMFYHIAQEMEQYGYRFLELTKMVKTDQYRYITNRHKGADTLPLGAGAGGSMNHLMMMNEIDLKKYADSVQNFQDRQGMLFRPGYTDIAIFKGDIQTLSLPRNESLCRDKIAYESLRDQLLDGGYVTRTESGFQMTHKGIFWGNSISRALSDLI